MLDGDRGINTTRVPRRAPPESTSASGVWHYAPMKRGPGLVASNRVYLTTAEVGHCAGRKPGRAENFIAGNQKPISLRGVADSAELLKSRS
jgi:hypothetical protein